jgi:tetratricopeptide (TPR) repeat protein
MKKIMLFIYIFSCTNFIYGFAQEQIPLPESEKIQNEIINNAKKLMNNEDYDSAINLLDSTARLYPKNYVFQYERAVAFFFKKRIKYSAYILDSLIKCGYEDPKIYQTLGNCYNQYGEPEKADTIFTTALKKYPNSGILYSELAYIKVSLGFKDEAIGLWESGVMTEPDLSNNYYPLSVYYSDLAAKFWSVIYGEIYLNLSQNDQRSKEISQNTFNTYFDSFGQPDSSGYHPIFTFINSMYNDTIDIPIEFAYQKTMKYALNSISKRHKADNSLEFLHLVRDKFVEYWQLSEYNKKYKNPLFDLWIELRNKGVFKVYNYVMFKEGNTEEFDAFIKDNNKAVSEFTKVFIKYRLILNKDNYLSKYKYAM